MIEFIFGVLLGGIGSWLITHEYSRQAIQLEKMRKTAASVLIDESISEVWQFISNPVCYRYFTLYDIPDEEANEVTMEAGAVFPSRRMSDFIFIIDYEPGKIISFGNNPMEWDHYIYLYHQGDKTLLYLYRAFSPYEERRSWWNMILSLIFRDTPPMNAYELVVDSINRIESGIKQWNQSKRT